MTTTALILWSALALSALPDDPPADQAEKSEKSDPALPAGEAEDEAPAAAEKPAEPPPAAPVIAPAPAEPAAAEAPPPAPTPPPPTEVDPYSDFIDSRVTFAFSNVNVFAKPGERTNPTSGYRIGVDPNFNLFLENVNTRFSGFESLSHIVIYKRLPGFFTNLETDVALAALLLADTNSGRFNLYDSGTYLRLIYKLGEGSEDKAGAVDLTAWPVSADRFRLGYTYLISWGGTAIFPGKLQSSSITEGAVPGFRLRYRAPNNKAYAYLGMKSALLLSREPGVLAGEQVPNYGFLGGGGVNLFDLLMVEANGGFFQKGTQERPGLEGRAINAFGGSARLTVYQGQAPSQSADFQLYRNDPRNPVSYLVYKPYKAGFGFSVAVEGDVLFQNLEDPDAFGTEEMVTALAAGLVGSLKIDAFQLRVDAFFQSANFLLFNVPGFVPFQSISDESKTTPEFFGALTVSYFLDAIKFLPSLSIGVKVPSTYEGRVLPAQGASVGGATPGETRVQVIVDETTRIVLPPGYGATPIIGAVLKLPFFLSESTTLAAEVRAEINDNQPRIVQDNERGEVTFRFDEPFRLGVGAVLQARF